MSAPDSASLQRRSSTAHRPSPSSARLRYTVLDLLGLSKMAPPRAQFVVLGNGAGACGQLPPSGLCGEASAKFK